MMQPEEFYRYYKLTGPAAQAVNDDYSGIPAIRTEVLSELLSNTGAVAICENHDWGKNGSLVSNVAFLADHPFKVPVTVRNRDKFEGRDVVVVTGRGNTKEARAFNAEIAEHISAANQKLKDAPSYIDFLITRFNVQCCTIGWGMTGRHGAAMISTHCGQSKNDKNVLLFAIPIPNENDRSKSPEIPAEFKEITYGQFYDLTN